MQPLLAAAFSFDQFCKAVLRKDRVALHTHTGNFQAHKYLLTYRFLCKCAQE